MSHVTKTIIRTRRPRPLPVIPGGGRVALPAIFSFRRLAYSSQHNEALPHIAVDPLAWA